MGASVCKSYDEEQIRFMRAKHFRYWLILLLAGILWELFFLYKDTLVWMKTAWFGYTPDRAGIFVPPLFVWMAYTRLKNIPKTTVDAPVWGCAVILFSLGAFILARVLDIHFIQALSLIGVIFGMVVYWGGVRFSANFIFPFVFLMLMIPSVSYLIESIAGAILRWAVLHGSYIVLKLGGGAWQLHPAGLQCGEAFLQVGFPRGGFASILFLLIVHFAAGEWALKNEARKIFFMVHFPLYFIIAYICFYTLSGWTLVLGNEFISLAFETVGGGIPLLCFILLVAAMLRLSGRSAGNRDKKKRR